MAISLSSVGIDKAEHWKWIHVADLRSWDAKVFLLFLFEASTFISSFDFCFIGLGRCSRHA